MSESVDTALIERAVREILIAIGEDPNRPGLTNTPSRVARALAETTEGLRYDPASHLDTTFPEDHNELVLVRDIPVYSMCEHHLLPFYGLAHIGYIPGESGKITGLSKLARLADGFAKRPQVQERLTSQIADAIVDKLEVQAVGVVLECEHMCMTMRGIRKPGSKTTTSAMRGLFRKSAASRAEFLTLIRG
ncbi:MAG: GTP cyclohydrolase I FolE [Corynebacterium sp.]|nr:GTP cyclohydrolase I FolE [Corynebacterium sp.]